jgi:hypothetical protein
MSLGRYCRVVCRGEILRVLHGIAYLERSIRRCWSWWWSHVDQGRVVLPRTRPEDQRLVNCHHPVTFPWPTIHGSYPERV